MGVPAYEDGTECSETLAYKLQTPGNYPKESIQQSNGCSVTLDILTVVAMYTRYTGIPLSSASRS